MATAEERPTTGEVMSSRIIPKRRFLFLFLFLGVSQS